MNQNTSSAVMQQRRTRGASLEHFPTPPWATRALCEALGGESALGHRSVWEPACAGGHMVKPLMEYFGQVEASDIHDYGAGFQVEDFLASELPVNDRPDWIITNPPFNLAEAFIAKARGIARCGVAMLVRTAFCEGKGRYERLYSVNPPQMEFQFVERVPMVKDRLDPKASTATAYTWLVWTPALAGTITQKRWIAPCRKRLEREGDYPETKEKVAA